MAKWKLDKSCDPNVLALNEHISKLEAQIKEDALQYLSDTGQMGDTIADLTRRHEHALHKIDVLEDEIDAIKAQAIRAIEQMQTASDAMMLHIARTTLAELRKGQSHG